MMMELSPMDTSGSIDVLKDTKNRLVSSLDIDRMEVDANALEVFLSSKTFVSTLCEGYFAVLMKDLRKEVWSHIDDDKTFAIAMRVNKRWRDELEIAWKQSCIRRGFLEEFWNDKGKDWKWQLKCFTVKFADGQPKNGPGTYEEKNGPYAGDWKDNKQEGYGKKIFADKSVYMGQWKDNMKHGQGTYIWEDKTRYVGGWKDDKYHGYGVKTWSDGDRYEGMWAEDRKHGTSLHDSHNSDLL